MDPLERIVRLQVGRETVPALRCVPIRIIPDETHLLFRFITDKWDVNTDTVM